MVHVSVGTIQPNMMFDLPPGGALTLTDVLAGVGTSPRVMVEFPPTACTTLTGMSVN